MQIKSATVQIALKKRLGVHFVSPLQKKSTQKPSIYAGQRVLFIFLKQIILCPKSYKIGQNKINMQVKMQVKTKQAGPSIRVARLLFSRRPGIF